MSDLERLMSLAYHGPADIHEVGRLANLAWFDAMIETCDDLLHRIGHREGEEAPAEPVLG